MDKDLEVKYNNLKEYLKSLESVAVAFSSGVDSTFLLKVAHDVLGDKAIAITLNAAAFPEKETNDARDFCKSEGIKHIICGYNPLDIEGFADNPPDRPASLHQSRPGRYTPELPGDPDDKLEAAGNTGNSTDIGILREVQAPCRELLQYDT